VVSFKKGVKKRVVLIQKRFFFNKKGFLPKKVFFTKKGFFLPKKGFSYQENGLMKKVELQLLFHNESTLN